MRNVRDAVAIEHNPRAQLGFGFGQFRLGDAGALDAIHLLDEHRFRRAERRAFGRRH